MQKESSGYWDQEVSIDSNASFADSGSFTDKTENGDGTPYELTISGDYKKNAWRPSSNYGYTLLSAYNQSGENDVKDFCMNYAGTAASLAELKYISDEEFSSIIIKTIESPFLKESFDSEYAAEEYTPAVLSEGAVYMIKNINSGLYMEVQNGTAEDGANVQQWGADSPLSHNSWTLKEFGGGYYYIISQLADGRTYYLNIAGGSGENGANAEILTNNKTSSHLFKFVKNPDGTYYILTRASKDAAAIETANADKSSGANISQWTVNGNSCQKWLAEEHVIATVTTTSVPVTTTSTVTTTTSVPATSGEESDGHIKGDINFDEKISVADLVLINNYLTGKEQFTYDQYSVSDLNNDGFINIFDVISLRRIILGKTE